MIGRVYSPEGAVRELKRDYHADLIRVVAMLLVICIHNWGSDTSSFAAALRSGIFLTCNGLFFMMSGRFNLRFTPDYERPCESYLLYYWKKFCNIIIPFLFYSTLLFIFPRIGNYDFTDVRQLFRDFFFEIYVTNPGTHMWFLYYLLGFLIAAPFISVMFRHMGQAEKRLFMYIGVWLSIINVILFKNVLQAFFPVNWSFTSWLFYFLMGYMLNEIDSFHRHIWAYVAFGICCLLMTAMIGAYIPEYVSGLFDDSPIFLFACIGIYLLLEAIPVSEKIGSVISFVAKYSFSVYLLHRMVLDMFKLEFPMIATTQTGMILIVPIVAILSFAIAFVCDSLILKPFEKYLIKGCWKHNGVVWIPGIITIGITVLIYAVIPIIITAVDKVGTLNLLQ